MPLTGWSSLNSCVFSSVNGCSLRDVSRDSAPPTSSIFSSMAESNSVRSDPRLTCRHRAISSFRIWKDRSYRSRRSALDFQQSQRQCFPVILLKSHRRVRRLLWGDRFRAIPGESLPKTRIYRHPHLLGRVLNHGSHAHRSSAEDFGASFFPGLLCSVMKSVPTSRCHVNARTEKLWRSTKTKLISRI